MSKIVNIQNIDPQTFELQTYSYDDTSLISSFEVANTFNPTSNYIEYFIYDLNNNRKAWQATVITEAQGTAFVGNIDAIAQSAIGSIIDRLKEEGHFQDITTK